MTSKPALRIGFRMVKGLSENASLSIVKARQAGQFSDIQELVFRCRINKKDLESSDIYTLRRIVPSDRNFDW